MGLPSLPECAAVLDRLAPSLLNAAARSVVVLGLVGAIVLLMRRASAAARHWVWVLGFAGLLLVPVLSATLPSWYVLPRFVGLKTASRIAENPPIRLSSSTPPPPNLTPRATPIDLRTEPVSGAPLQSPVVRQPVSAQTSALVVAAGHAAPLEDSGRSAMKWTSWLVLFWLVGSLLVLGHVLLAYLSLWSLQRRCTRVTQGDLYDLVNQLRAELGIGRPVELLSSPERMMPMTWGLLRSRLLLPKQAANWLPEQRRAVLLHELGHVKRWDCLTQLLVQIACAGYWMNPIGWIAGRRMQVERERACDDLVLNSGADASSYARYLLQSISAVPSFRLLGAAVAMARPSTLEERLRAILDRGRNRRTLGVRSGAATMLLLLTTVVPVAVVKAQQDVAQQPPAVHALRATPATQPAVGSPTGRAGSRSGMRGFGQLAKPTPGQGPTCDFDATIYDVRMPADQIGRLDIDALDKAAANAESFEKALAALGPVKPLYRANQSVRLSGENVMIETQAPVVTSTATAANGHPITSYQYMSTGAIFSIAGNAGSTGPIDLDLAIQLSALADSGVTLDKSIKVPVIRGLTIAHKGPVEPRKPFVVVSVDANSVDASGKAVAYIGRITVGEPHLTAGQGQ